MPPTPTESVRNQITPESIGLISSEITNPGFTRQLGDEDKWEFHAPDGSSLPSKKREYCHSLSIPPAWTNVWISPSPEGHILACGFDEAGRKQYLYHPKFRQAREHAKFRDLCTFANGLPRLRRKIRTTLNESEDTTQIAIAAVIRLLDEAGLRIGNKRFYRSSGVKGATTLRKKNISIHRSTISLEYIAKGSSTLTSGALIYDAPEKLNRNRPF